MNNNCKNCGKELDSGARFCPECGTPVIEEVQVVELSSEPTTELLQEEVKTEPSPEELQKKKEAEKKHVMIIFSLFGGSLLCQFLSSYVKAEGFFSMLSVVLGLLGFIALIYGRTKYKDNKVIKGTLITVVVIAVLNIIISIVIFILLIFACKAIFDNPPTNCG
jgi:uncharacterized membrane protein YvbJ